MSIHKLLSDIASDPNLLDQFRSSPERIADRYDLSEDERAAVLSRDSALIKRALTRKTDSAFAADDQDVDHDVDLSPHEVDIPAENHE
jgi:hypothetical protein